MVGRYVEFQSAVARAVGHVVERAMNPTVRVARHWESTSRLAWFGACADHHVQHVSWSFGRLRDVPVLAGQRHHVGVFGLLSASFPEVDEAGVRSSLEALIPPGTDGATRVFLQRVSAQLAMADVLLSLPERLGDCEVSLFARPDAVDTAASTPRWPEHARERVAAALDAMDAELRTRCERLWSAEPPTLLDAARLARSNA
jgi:hypothetical protein